MNLKSTQQGIALIRQALKNQGWKWNNDTAPLVEASSCVGWVEERNPT